MNIDKKIATRQSYGEALKELGENNNEENTNNENSNNINSNSNSKSMNKNNVNEEEEFSNDEITNYTFSIIDFKNLLLIQIRIRYVIQNTT